ncbi:hypothetical protein PAMP_015309 [Pampus punctatissimus]
MYLFLRSRQHGGGCRSAPPATLLPRPAVAYGGLAEGGRAAVQQEHRGEAETEQEVQAEAEAAAAADDDDEEEGEEKRRGGGDQLTPTSLYSSRIRMTSFKLLFINFNIFFMIAAAVVIAVALALLSLSVDVLYAGDDYLVCVVAGGLLLLQAVVAGAVVRPKLVSVMEDRWRSRLPLDQASDDIKNQVKALQTSLHCCGLFSYEDWQQNIPDSCLCDQEEQLEGQCQPVSDRNFLMNLFWQKKSVFTQTCFPSIVASVITSADITLSVEATLFVLLLLGLVLSSLMIYQMFINQPPNYQQLYNIPE